jgi:chemotaxis signal transduction protein
MSGMPVDDVARQDRLLTFEVARTVYALPIAGVDEVAELGELACIPTLPPEAAGVMNLHGDALPVIDRARLLDLGSRPLPDPQHILVLRQGEVRLGLPVDRVIGLVDGRGALTSGPGPVAERRREDDRVLNILDLERLVVRARRVIESSSATDG